MKKGDFVILGAVLAAGLLALLLVLMQHNKNAKFVVVKQDNQVVYCVPLNQDATLPLKNNVVQVKDGRVFMKSATCRNQICVDHAPISKVGESIVCLPNRVSITISSKEEKHG